MGLRNCASSSNGSPPAAGAPTHSHPVEEVLTVLDGEAEMWIDDVRAIVAAGQSLIVPAHRNHGFRNSGTVTLHIHAVLASAVFEADAGRRDGGGAAVGIVRWARRFAPLPTLRRKSSQKNSCDMSGP